MQTHLRPMTLGEILDRTAQLYRTHFALFAGISALNAGTILVLNLGQIGIAQLLTHLHMGKQLPWVTIGFLVLMLPLMFISAVVAVAANNRAVAWVNLGQPATIRGAYASILPRLGRYVWLTLRMLLVIYTPYLAVAGGYVVFIFLYIRPRHLLAPGQGNQNPQSMVVFGLVSIGFALLITLVLVYVILMALRYSLAVPAAVVEELAAGPAIRRSIDLSKGARGRIFVLGLLIAAIQICLVLFTQLPFLIVAFKNHFVISAMMQTLQQLVGFLTNTFIGPMYATGLTLFYYDQRIRKEGFDIEWMMQAAGMTAAPAGIEAAASLEPWPELPPEQHSLPATSDAEPPTPAPPSDPAQPSGPAQPSEPEPPLPSDAPATRPPSETPPESSHG